MARWKSFDGSRSFALAWALVALALALAAVELPGRVRMATGLLAMRRQSPTGEAQMRQIVGSEIYDALAFADRNLPPEATVLLVTPGVDVRHAEYTAYHRALYMLAPRPVWWVAPAPADGTWESRWWTTTTVDRAALSAQARSLAATHLLGLRVDPLSLPGQLIGGAPPDTVLTRLGDTIVVVPSRRRETGLDVWWPLWLLLAAGIPLLVGYVVIDIMPGAQEQRGLEHNCAGSSVMTSGSPDR